ncbi:hypothetical protein R0381_002105 [Jeongeupia wiesaeckerbachi]|uniref:hypothetical protein n=1 Tax=Jeongeupia wiesaeckerbachi TaxID=3051218 RepID=UPI003D80A07A
MLKTLLWTSLGLLVVTLTLLAGVFVGQQLSDADAAGQEARATALAQELAQSRGEIDRLRAELVLRASQVAVVMAASAASDVATAIVPPTAVPVPVSLPVREPAYRRFGNVSCTLSTDGGSIEDGCAELRQASASMP